MKPDLIGYVLHALQPDEERQIEAYLEETPEARRELQRFRPLLNALETQEDYEPSKELIFQTLRAVASERCHEKEPASIAGKCTKPLTGTLSKLEPWKESAYDALPTHWRRADAWALIAVVMFLCLAIPPVLQYVRDRALQTECRDNMRHLYSSFDNYMTDHQGAIPVLAADGPASHAGVYASVLHDAGLWGERLRLGCPPGSSTKPQPLSEVQLHNEQEHNYWQRFGGNYAYNLGYVQNQDGITKVIPIKKGDGDSIPILADRPPRFGEVNDWAIANSPNHGGRGQNVLHLDGHVNFQKYRSAVGGDDRDIFRNDDNQQNAGNKLKDIVLGPSEARPLPPPVPID